jgi:TRAP-type uncharacterized transport system substrate-binding protein
LVKRIAPNQILTCLLVMAILAIFSLSAAAGERHALTLSQGSGDDGQAAVSAQLLSALLEPDDVVVCRRAGNCHPDRLQLSFDRSATASAALGKLRAGVAQLLVLPAPLAQLSAQANSQEIAAVPNLQTLARVGSLNLYILVPAQRPSLTLESLQQGRLLFSSAGSDLTLTARVLLTRMGLPPKNYTSLYMAGVADRMRRLQRGQAEAVILLAHSLPGEFTEAVQRGELQLLSLGKSEIQQALLGFAGVHSVAVVTGAGPAYRTLQIEQQLLTTASLPLAQAQSLLERLRRAAVRGVYTGLQFAAPPPAAPLHPAATSIKSDLDNPSAEGAPYVTAPATQHD